MCSVVMDQHSISVNGKKKILLCASLFYFRIPREDWASRMRDLRSCGYNCIDVYFPWNFHELHPDDWHFEGMHDCGEFLKLAAENDLYVIARPGPYICSEWDGGALPAWLNDACPELRQNDPQYLQYLSRWLSRILPIIARYEAGKEGSVVALQLENEMDFFGCRDPEGYMTRLTEIAARCGITVPIVACAGECDVQGAGCLAPRVHPTFNVYTPDGFEFLETQLAHMRALAAARNTPLLVTETNREHAFLKRELLSGARLISPYNQVGGTDLDMTNGISNWSADPQRPLALMATDYDFHSMITVDGRKRVEALQGRLTGSLIASLAELLACAEPVDCPLSVSCDFPAAKRLCEDGRETAFFPALKMDHGAFLFGVSNLGSAPGTFTARSQQVSFTSRVQAQETRIYPYQFSLQPWGYAAVILWAEAELISISPHEDGLMITFTGSADERVSILHEGKESVFTGAASFGSLHFRVIRQEEAIRLPSASFPDLAGSIPSAIRTENVRSILQHPYSVLDHAVPVGSALQPMEAYGIVRGDIFYRIHLEKACSVLITDPADLVWINNQHRKTAFYGDGSTCLLENLAPGETCVRIQSWGHVNFDDVRQPSLKMGSKKGLSGIYAVHDTQDLTSLWMIYPEGKYAIQQNAALKASDRILATTLNSWSYPVSPMKADYVRPVHLSPDADCFFLFIENPAAEIQASVDDGEPVIFRSNDHFVRLSVKKNHGSGATLQLRVSRHFSHDSLGRILLYSCTQLSGAAVSAFPVDCWQQLQPGDQGCSAAFPVALDALAEELLTDFAPTDPPRGATLVLQGAGIEATLCGHGHVIGRVVLNTPNYPEVRGGSSRRIYVPRTWLDESLVLHLAALGSGGCLTALQWESIVS